MSNSIYPSIEHSNKIDSFKKWYIGNKLTPFYEEFWELDFAFQRDIFELFLRSLNLHYQRQFKYILYKNKVKTSNVFDTIKELIVFCFNEI